MENKIGRYLTKKIKSSSRIKNADTMNNKISNLQIMTPSEHSKHHQNLRKCKGK